MIAALTAAGVTLPRYFSVILYNATLLAFIAYVLLVWIKRTRNSRDRRS